MSTRNRVSARSSNSVRPSFGQFPNSSAAAEADRLPEYRKPSHPLTIKAQDQIKALNGRPINHIKDHSGKAARKITEVAGLINDKLHDHEEGMAKRRRRWERGLDTENQENEEAWSMTFKKKVDDTTKQLEETMRGIIDTGVAADRMEESLRWLHQNAPSRLDDEYRTQTTQRDSLTQSQQRRDTQGSEVISEGPTPGPTPLDGSRVVLTGVNEIFQDRLTRKKDEYTSRSLGGRYAEHTDYKNFKMIVHDAKYGDDRQLPKPDTWFTETGSPAPGITQRGDDDDEDDIVMDRASISTRCPITFQRFKEPWTSSKCPHTFEKTAILDMIRLSKTRVGGGGPGNRQGGEKAVECPVTGCSQLLTAGDLHHDPILVRKLQRMERAERLAAEDSANEEEVGLSQIESQHRTPVKVKAEPSSRLPPRSSHIEDLGSPSGDESQQPPDSTHVEDLGSPSGSDEDDEDE